LLQKSRNPYTVPQNQQFFYLENLEIYLKEALRSHSAIKI
jgi:hypothetical protein